MKLLFEILSVVLAIVMFFSASMDFRGDPRVIELVQRLQYRPGFERTLGIIKILGGVGLLLGLFAHIVGIAAAFGLTLYFALAVRAHFRAADPVKEAFPAFGLLIVSAFLLVLGIAA